MGFVRLFGSTLRHWNIHNGFSCVSPFVHCYISGCRLISQVSELRKNADFSVFTKMDGINTLSCFGSPGPVMSDPNLSTDLSYGKSGSFQGQYHIVPSICSGAILVRSWETNMRRGTYRSRRRKRFIRVGERILRIS